MEIKTRNTIYGNCQYWEDNESKTQYYSDHADKIRKLKNPDKNLYNKKIENHNLIGKKFINSKGKECVVESVHKQWYFGYYEIILYYTLSETKSEILCTDIIDGKMYGRSHGTLYFKNISCNYPSILQNIEKNKKIIFK